MHPQINKRISLRYKTIQQSITRGVCLSELIQVKIRIKGIRK